MKQSLMVFLTLFAFALSAKADCFGGLEDCVESNNESASPTASSQGQTTELRATSSGPEVQGETFGPPAPPVERPAAVRPAPARRATNNTNQETPKKTPEPAATQNQNTASRTESEANPYEEKIRLAEEALSTCETNAESTVSSCSTDRSGMSGSAMDFADVFAQSMPQTNINVSTVEICQKTAHMAGAANAALTGIKANCSFSYDSCADSCKEATKAIRALPSSHQDQFRERMKIGQTKCNSAKTRLQGIDQNLARAMAAYQRSQTCASDVAAANAALIPTLAQCQANPALQNCNMVLPQDCSNATVAANNLSCICQATNGRDPRCGQFNYTGSSPNVGGSSISSSGFDGAKGGSTGAASLLADAALGSLGSQEAPNLDGPGKSGREPQQLPGGGGEGRAGSISSANEAKIKQAAAAPESKIKTDLYKGTVGGASATTGFGRGGVAGDSGSYSKAGSWIPPKVTQNPNMINYNQFRPKGLSYDRGVASNGNVVLSSGLLAPHVDIWRQLNTRYLQMATTLTP